MQSASTLRDGASARDFAFARAKRVFRGAAQTDAIEHGDRFGKRHESGV